MPATVLMTQTLPTIVGMGVVSRTTETMLGKKGKRSKGKVRSKSGTVIVGVSLTRSGAENHATGYRRALRQQGKPYIGKVKVMRTPGGYAAVCLRSS